jgi:5-formyltetrahydrofolate cyclo-ligase
MKSKKELRTAYKSCRKALSENDIDEQSLLIANQSLNLNIWDHVTYHLFLSIAEQKEVQTEYLLHILQGKDKNVVVSKSNFENHSMTHYLLTDQTNLKKNAYNIPEPEGKGLIEIQPVTIDVVFIPLLVADEKGSRIGYGKGFYDRFLANCKPEVVKIGLSFFEPLSEEIEVGEFDVKLDYLITPREVFKF